MKYPKAHKIKKPFRYVPADATDITKTFERLRQEQQSKPKAVVRQLISRST